LCVVGGYAQYAIRPSQFLVSVPDGIDPAEAVCIPLAYLTAFQMLTRCRKLPSGATILVIGASGTVGTALLDLARHLGLKAIGTCSTGPIRRAIPDADPRGKSRSSDDLTAVRAAVLIPLWLLYPGVRSRLQLIHSALATASS
jgi:hypothetical protein